MRLKRRSAGFVTLLVPMVLRAQTPEPANPVKLSGYVTASYSYASKPTGGVIAGRLYDRLHNQFQLNAARLTVLRQPATDKLDAGFQVDLLYGQNAPQIRSAGLSLGDHGDLPQAFVTLNIPAGHDGYLRLSAGKRWTMMDVEYLDEILNPNFSHGYAFVYASNFTDTGLSLDAHFSSRVELGLRIINGWDVVEDNNSRKSFMGRLALTPSDRVALSLLGYLGPEQAGNGNDNRYGGQFVGTLKPAATATIYAELDAGREEGLGASGGKASWLAAGLWGVFDLSPKLGLALRGDYLRDKDGVRTSGVFGFPSAPSRTLTSGTLTLNVKGWEHALVRPELRIERSNRADFGNPGAPSKTQATFGLALSYVF